jgi:glucans biosynthesis protein C
MNARRHDMDWLRIIAFGLLIFYHIGMFYVTWGWHVKSSRASHAIEPLMLLVNPWRLTLLFLISGVATRFLADKLSLGQFTTSRMKRLWPPLILAVLVIVPPQCYLEVVEALQEISGPIGPPQSLWLQNFYIKYITASGNWCDHDGCLITPTYNHMWFVAYLIIYTLVLLPCIPLLRRLPGSAAKLIQGSGLILVPWIYLFITRATLQPTFGETHAIWNDWYLHSIYLATFLFGFAVAKHQSFFDNCSRLRWITLIVALVAWAVLITNAYVLHNNTSEMPIWVRNLFRGIHELQAWTAIVAAIGFAHCYLRNVDSPIKRTLSQAIFPFYLIHQTIIVVTAHYLNALALPLPIEVTLLIATTALGCWLFFDLGRRIPILRPWIGLAH